MIAISSHLYYVFDFAFAAFISFFNLFSWFSLPVNHCFDLVPVKLVDIECIVLIVLHFHSCCCFPQSRQLSPVFLKQTLHPLSAEHKGRVPNIHAGH